MTTEIIKELQGRTFDGVVRGTDDWNGDEIVFSNTHGSYSMHHNQDCCECVSIEEVHGDLNDLVGTPILTAEVRSKDDVYQLGDGIGAWTFYEFRTIKGSVTIRWYGTSNGYYSVGVSISPVTK